MLSRRQVEQIIDIAMQDRSRLVWFVDGTRIKAIEATIAAQHQGMQSMIDAAAAALDGGSISALNDDPHDCFRTDLLLSATLPPPGRNDFAQEAQK